VRGALTHDGEPEPAARLGRVEPVVVGHLQPRILVGGLECERDAARPRELQDIAQGLLRDATQVLLNRRGESGLIEPGFDGQAGSPLDGRQARPQCGTEPLLLEHRWA
jgi:hypothetical protein